MKELFKTIKKDSVLQTSFWVTIILLVITLGAIAVIYINLPPFLPLYNHLPWGYGRLGKTYELFIPPLVVIFVGIVNTFLGTKLLEKNPLLARFLFVTMLGLAACTAIFVARLIFLVL